MLLCQKILIAGFVALLFTCLLIPALSTHPGSPTLLLFCLLIPATLFLLISALLSHSLLPALLSYYLIPALLSYLFVPVFLFFSLPALSFFPVFALLSCSILDPALTDFISLVLKILKQALSDKILCRHSIKPNSAKLLGMFQTYSLLPKKSNYKWPVDTIFITSYLFAGNYTAKKINLSFKKYGYPVPVKFNRL